MAKSTGSVRGAEAQFPKGISWAPIPLDNAIKLFAPRNWREAAQRAASPGQRDLYSDMASASQLFLQVENPLVVRTLKAGERVTKRGATDKDRSDFAKLGQEAGRRFLKMSEDTTYSTNERRGLLLLGNRLMNAVNQYVLPGK